MKKKLIQYNLINANENILLYPFLLIAVFSNLQSNDFLILQSTTSTRDSGFYDFILPEFKKNLILMSESLQLEQDRLLKILRIVMLTFLLHIIRSLN